MWKNKKELKTNNTTSKNFNYEKGGVSLSFSLRTDTKDQLQNFYDLLGVAIKEVKEELDK